MNKKDFYRFIEQGALEGACRYFEYWFIYKNVPEHSRVLEIGAGRSMLPKAMIEKHCNVYVTDIDKSAIKFQLDNGVISELTDNLDSFGDKMFDVVISASSIEHFDNDRKTVAEVARVLKDNGIFILALPVGKELILNKHQGTKHPKEKIYDFGEYQDVFLGLFKDEKIEMYRGSDEMPKDFIPHETWKGAKSTMPVKDWNNGTGLCVVLRKI